MSEATAPFTYVDAVAMTMAGYRVTRDGWLGSFLWWVPGGAIYILDDDMMGMDPLSWPLWMPSDEEVAATDYRFWNRLTDLQS